MKALLNKLMLDVVICGGLLFPNLFPQFEFSSGIRTSFVVIMFITVCLGVLSILAMSGIKKTGKRIYNDKTLESTGLGFRIYEPVSDLAIMVSLIIAGHAIIAGVFVFIGLFQRGIRYQEYEEYREELENGSENN